MRSALRQNASYERIVATWASWSGVSTQPANVRRKPSRSAWNRRVSWMRNRMIPASKRGAASHTTSASRSASTKSPTCIASLAAATSRSAGTGAPPSSDHAATRIRSQPRRAPCSCTAAASSRYTVRASSRDRLRRNTSPYRGCASRTSVRRPSSVTVIQPPRSRSTSEPLSVTRSSRPSPIGSARATTASASRPAWSRWWSRPATKSTSFGAAATVSSSVVVPASFMVLARVDTNSGLQPVRRTRSSAASGSRSVSSSAFAIAIASAGVRSPTGHRSTCPLAHSSLIGSGAHSPSWTVATRITEPAVTSWLTSVADVASRRCVSSRPSTSGRSPPRPAIAVRAATSSDTPSYRSTSPDSSGAKAASGTSAMAARPRTNRATSPDASAIATSSSARRVLPVPAAPWSTTPRRPSASNRSKRLTSVARPTSEVCARRVLTRARSPGGAMCCRVCPSHRTRSSPIRRWCA